MKERMSASSLDVTEFATIERLLPLLKLLAKQVGQKYDGKALARQAGLSQRHLDRLFKAIVGETPRQYLYNLRMRRARTYLTRTGLSAKEITARIGFKYEHHFTREFKRQHGLPPIAYRHQHWRSR